VVIVVLRRILRRSTLAVVREYIENQKRPACYVTAFLPALT
jgi:hypothetical protein